MNKYIKAGLLLATSVLVFALLVLLVRLIPYFGIFVVFLILAIPAYVVCLAVVSLLDG